MINVQDIHGWTALHFAGSSPQAVELLLQHGADPSIPTKDTGLTPLFTNACDGNTESAAVLCQYGASVGAADGMGKTALMIAAMCSTKVLRQFLQKFVGSDRIVINAQDQNGWTALHWAAKDSEAVKLLLEHGANPSIRNSESATPLLYAAYEGSTAASASLLLKYGAIADEVSNDGNTVLMTAAMYNTKVLRHFLQELDCSDIINAQDVNGSTALHLAIENPKAIKLLLEHGANPNMQDNQGATPLYWAVRDGKTASAAVLWKYGATVKDITNSGTTVFMLAAQHSTEVLRYFLRKLKCSGIVNAKDYLGWTALHWAYENSDAVKLLLEHGANPKIRNNEGETPLYWAVRGGDTESAAMLWENGASVYDVDNKKGTVLMIAAQYSTKALQYFLREWKCSNIDSNGWTALHWACESQQAVSLLLERGADLNARTKKNGETPLYWAVRKGNTESAAKLWKNGARANDLDNNNSTVVMVAANYSTEVLQYLLRELKCSDMAFGQDNHGRTALHWACARQTQAVALLLEHGADPFVKDQFGSTPFDEAIGQPSHPQKQPIIDLLLQHYKRKLIAHKGDQCLHWILQAATYNEGKVTLPVGTLSIDHMLAFLTLFVSQHANLISTINNVGSLPLHVACQYPKTPIKLMEFLVEQDPSTIRQTDHAGNLPIHRLCAFRPSLQKLKYVLDCDAESISAWNNRGSTPFAVAALASASVEILWYMKKAHPAAAPESLPFLVE